MRKLIYQLTLLLCLLVPPISSAATLNVPTAFATIQAAIDAAVDGDTVLVSPGTYAENLVIFTTISLVSTHGAESTIIDGGGSATSSTIRIRAPIVLDGFKVINGSGGINLTQGATIRNNIIEFNLGDLTGPGGGINVNSGSGAVIENNIIRNNGSEYPKLVI